MVVTVIPPNTFIQEYSANNIKVILPYEIILLFMVLIFIMN